MMQTDVKSAYGTAVGVLYAGRTRLKQIAYLGTGTAGTFTLYDNASAAAGNILFQFKFSTAIQPGVIPLPGEGILAENGVYADFTNLSAISICYG